MLKKIILAVSLSFSFAISADFSENFTSIYSTSGTTFNKLPLDKVSVIESNGIYAILYSTSFYFPINDFKIFLPKFTQTLKTSSIIVGSAGSIYGHIAMGGRPDVTVTSSNATSGEKFLNMLTNGETVYMTNISYIKFTIGESIYKKDLNKWIYFDVNATAPATYMQFSYSTYLNKKAVDDYIDNHPELSHPDCKEGEKKKICIFIRTLDTSGNTQSINSAILSPQILLLLL